MARRHVITSFLAGTAMTALILTVSGSPRSFANTDHRDLDLLANVIDLVRKHYVQEVDERQLVEGAVRGMLATLDPHTSYLSKEFYEEMQRETRGEFEGLGIEISKREGFVTVVAPIKDTPAAAAGLRALDQIRAVCPEPENLKSCKSTQDMELFDAVKLMRGKRGTKVMLRVLREGWEMPREIVIERASVTVPIVEMHTMDDSLVYVSLSQFTETAEGALRKSLDDARRQLNHEIGGVVLDLRDNPGGLLEQAVRVADLFLDEGVIVSSEGRNKSGRMEWRANAETSEPDYPIVVLVNGGSASASEIVAGALQDHKRAFVVGTETFGKGSVQTIMPLEGGTAGLRLTTQLYYLPSGRSIQEVRVQPDLVVESFSQEMIDALDRSTREQKSFGEEDLEGHLSLGREPSAAEKKAPAGDPKTTLEPGEEPLTKEQQFRRQLQIDRQLMQAVALLKSAPIFSKRLYVADPS